MRRPPLSYSNVVSTLALFIALGGTSIAAVSLGRNAVQRAHVAPNAIDGSKVQDGSLTRADFRAAASTGMTGRVQTFKVRTFTVPAAPGPVAVAGTATIPLKGTLRQPAGSFSWVQVSGRLTSPRNCFRGEDGGNLDDAPMAWYVRSSDGRVLFGEDGGTELGRTARLGDAPGIGGDGERAELQPTNEVPSARARTRRLSFRVDNFCTQGTYRFEDVVVRVLTIG